MFHAARLDGETFKQLRDDQSATVQSISVVAIVSFCYGLGFSLFSLEGSPALVILTLTLAYLVAGILIAFLWSGASFLIVTKLFRKSINYSGLFRPFFFSLAPGILFIGMASPIPGVSDLLRVAATIWVVVASVVAVKNAAGVSTTQSMGVFMICVLLLLVAQAALPF